MKYYGVIGNPLTHTFSKKYFTKRFSKEKKVRYEYHNFPLEDIFELNRLLTLTPELQGFNVSLPYKEKICKYLSQIDIPAKEIGAVNVVKVNRNNSNYELIGYNTDVYGFYYSLLPLIETDIKSVLILGSGGVAKSVIYVLKKLNINYTIVSRLPEKKENTIYYSELDESILKNHLLIINTTPLGLYPKINYMPQLPYKYLSDKHILYDLIYNPKKSQFLKMGEFYHCKIKNGIEMLEIQAGYSYKIFMNQFETEKKHLPF